MANRDKSTETKKESSAAIEAAATVVVPKAGKRFFPTSKDCIRARRAVGKMRPNHAASMDELIAVVDSLKAERRG